MKNKNSIILAALIALLIFVPYPPIVLKFMYYADFVFGFVIFEICIFCIFKKSYPKTIPSVLPAMLIYFCIYSIGLNIATVRMILIMQNSIPLITEYAEGGFLKFPYAGYFIFVVSIPGVILFSQKNKDFEDEKIKESFVYIRATIKIYSLTFLVSLSGSTIIAVLKNNLSFKESIIKSLGYSCAELSFYFLQMIFICVGVDALLSVIKSKTKFFSNL